MKKNASRPTKIKGKRKHGFRKRMSTASGQDVLRRRRKKGRARVSV